MLISFCGMFLVVLLFCYKVVVVFCLCLYFVFLLLVYLGGWFGCKLVQNCLLVVGEVGVGLGEGLVQCLNCFGVVYVVVELVYYELFRGFQLQVGGYIVGVFVQYVLKVVQCVRVGCFEVDGYVYDFGYFGQLFDVYDFFGDGVQVVVFGFQFYDDQCGCVVDQFGFNLVIGV